MRVPRLLRPLRRPWRLGAFALAVGAPAGAWAAAPVAGAGDPPSIAGASREGQSLKVAPGPWTARGRRYAWKRCDGRGRACLGIPGATSARYELGPADVGSTLRVVVTAGSTAAWTAPSAPVAPAVRPAPGALLFSDGFGTRRPGGLLGNEYAYWNERDPRAVVSPRWELTSGSLFSEQGWGWTGAPDACAPDRLSATCTDSAVFRLNTRRFDFADVAVSFSLLNTTLVSTSKTPAQDWDGVHVWLRYQSQYELYYASANRRDGAVVIKKKCRGGSSNEGTYYVLGSYVGGHPIPFGVRQTVRASVRTRPDGSVTIALYRDGALVDAATDRGVGCAPITAAGAVGIRGDNDEFRLDDFRVERLG